MGLLTSAIWCLILTFCWIVYLFFIQPLFSPLRNLPGPSARWGLGLGGHLEEVLNLRRSKLAHEEYTDKYGKTIRIKGIGNYDDRIHTTDPVALAYIMNHTNDYQKPWQSRRVISRLIGEGMLAAEGQMHKRMRRVGTPAFSISNMRAFIPIAFKKGRELREKWNSIVSEPQGPESFSSKDESTSVKIDVCHWISRATFDVIGLAGFDYNFSAIQHENNELFMAYKDMFEVAISQGGGLWDIAIVYFPWLESIFPTRKTRVVRQSQEIINRIGGEIIQEKIRRISDGEKNGSGYNGVDFLSLLIKSNLSQDIDPSQRITNTELLSNVNTFFFAGSDTTSLALTWILYLLAASPKIQDRLRSELQTLKESLSTLPSYDERDGWQEIWTTLDNHPYLNNVIREALRIIPPVQSSIRVAMRDDEIPTSEPIRMKDGSVHYGFKIGKGQFVHIPVEGMNTDRSVWGQDAWIFNPDRWDNLPASVLELPGLYNNTLSFSAGPRSCIGMRFSIIEMKSFLFELIPNFKFNLIKEERVFAANVVLTRPYVSGKYKEGSQCPLHVSRV